MKNEIAAGMQVRCKGRAETGKVVKVNDNFALVDYEARPGTITQGYYPVEHLEVLAPARVAAPAPAKEVASGK